jgi:DNA excision repair protein ERCC-6
MLNIIQRFTELQGWKFGRLDGSTNVASRQRLVDTFNNDESYFGMLMTTRTGGVGLNLTGADRIILYDPDWNPQSEYDPDWNCHVERNQKLTLSSFIP